MINIIRDFTSNIKNNLARSYSNISNNLIVPGIWNDHAYSLNNILLTKNIIRIHLNKFWNDVMNHLTDDQYVILLFRIQFEDGIYATLNHLQKINKNDFKELLDLLSDILDIKSEEYHSTPIKNVIISYKIIPADKLVLHKSKLVTNIKKRKVTTYKFYGYNLPATMDYNLFGNVLTKINNKIIIAKTNSSFIYSIEIFDNYNNVEILHNQKVILKFKDMKNDLNNLSTFNRLIKNQEYVFKNGLLIVKKLNRNSSYLESVNISKNLIEKFITLDIETRVINDIISPYCICYYEGHKSYSFYLSDYNNPNDMIKSCLISLMKKKYDGYKIYVHNLSNFDGIFLLKILSSFDNCSLKPKIKDGKFINLQLNFNKYKIYFRDSFLMLPLSLRKLAKAFQVDIQKGYFPYRFVTETNLEYIGITPDISFFDFKYDENLDDNEFMARKMEIYNNLISTTWNLRSETIKYCIDDCVSPSP